MRACLVSLLLALLPAAALAAESAPVVTPRTSVSLVSDTDGVASDRPFRLGLKFRMAPGWHVYWSNPGDAGVPPSLELSLPKGSRSGEFSWPTPERLMEGPVMTYAYTGELLLPLTVTPGPVDGGYRVEAKGSWLVCEKICIPEEGAFRLDLAVGQGASSSPQAPLFAAADARMPRPSPFAAGIEPNGRLVLSGDGLSAASVKDAWFFPSQWGAVEHAAPQPLSVGKGSLTLALKPGSAFDPKGGVDGVVVLQDPSGQQTALAVSAKPVVASPAAEVAAGRMLLFALLGGLLLNLMPCVFPVLAIKAISLAGLGGAARGQVRAEAACYTAGVLAMFAVLGGAMLALRAAGSAAGWGFQFQSPAFVMAMAWLLFAIGLNLSGVYAIGGGLAGIGEGLAGRRSLAGSFFTGLLAVVVATPCTAPFMGVAVAAGLAAPAWLAMATFLAMGIGLAAPYLAFALAPGLARWLPRPGAWMEWLRQVMAFPMYGAAAWLVWVTSQQTGSTGVLLALAGLVLVGFALWLFGAAARAGLRGRLIARLVAGCAVAAAIGLLFQGNSAPEARSAAAADALWQPYSAERLAALRADGRPVFVDMTAAWCVTCLVNEKVAHETAAVRQAFAAGNIAALRGDWTNQAPEVTAFLREHARDGVPLYVFYPAGNRPPSVLPQILTESLVLEELNQSGS